MKLVSSSRLVVVSVTSNVLPLTMFFQRYLKISVGSDILDGNAFKRVEKTSSGPFIFCSDKEWTRKGESFTDA